MVFAIILLVLLCFSVLYNLSNFASSFMSPRARYTHSAGPKLDEVLTEDNNSVNKIAVVEISGIITGDREQGAFGKVEMIKAQLKHAEEDEHVKAVILKVDSPGGEVLASDEIYRTIDDFQKKSDKPVVASMGSLAASGGYYVSAPCRWIVANELTITGSIGVIMHSYNYRGLMNKVGLLPEVYKSGKFKDMLSGDRDPKDIPPEEREMVQSLIDETYGKFKEAVSQGREKAFEKNKNAKQKSRALTQDWTNYADGRVLSGSEAYKLGFVDELGNFEDAVARARALVNVRHANVVEYQQRYDLSDLFRLFGKSEKPALKVDLGTELPKLKLGQPYFLSPTFAH